MLATFVQLPLEQPGQALPRGRFLLAALIGNFAVAPLLAWLVTRLPLHETAAFGLLLVLVMPCTDWFITFTALGKGNAAKAAGLAPVLLGIQLALLPAYLWLFTGSASAALLSPPVVLATAAVLLVPLVAAVLVRRSLAKWRGGKAAVAKLAWLPVPTLALVIMLVVSSHGQSALASGLNLPVVVAVCLLYALGSLVAAALLGKGMRLDVPDARTLAFSLGTRNSFMVLPIALALPDGMVGLPLSWWCSR